MLTSERKRLDTVLGLQRTITVSDEKIIEELHIEVVILDDQYLLPYRPIGLHLRFCNVQCHAPSLETDRFCPMAPAARRLATAVSAPAALVLSKGSNLIIRNRPA
jgi:hypothetical protein